MGKRTILSGLGLTVGTAAMLLSSSAFADEPHCSDRSLKAAALAKLGVPKQTTDLTISAVTLDESRAVSSEAKGGAQTVVVSTPTASNTLQVNVAAEADVGVLVCVYMRGTEYGAGLEGWKKVPHPNELHGAYGDPLGTNKVSESFSVEGKHEASYGYGIRPDSSWDASHVVAVVLTPKKGDAKFSIGLNKPATHPAAQDALLGVDRGAFFSKKAVEWMEYYNWHDKEDGPVSKITKEGKDKGKDKSLSVGDINGHCLAAVKRTLRDTSSQIPYSEGTEEAKDFLTIMRNRDVIKGYHELVPSEVKFTPLADKKAAEEELNLGIHGRWNYRRLPELQSRLPVGTIIVYENFNAKDEGFSYKHGHIDMVADYNGRKSLMSDHIGPSNGWGWLEPHRGCEKTPKRPCKHDLKMSIFVPTETNQVPRVKPVQASNHSKDPKGADPKAATPAKTDGPAPKTAGPAPKTAGPAPKTAGPTPKTGGPAPKLATPPKKVAVHRPMGTTGGPPGMFDD